VWQRKNTISTEPFATGLFVRKQGGPWKVFLLDFQDSYRSSIVLRPKGAGVVEVLQDNRKLGDFDETQGVLRRDLESRTLTDTGEILNSEPPGNWWLEATASRRH